MVKLSLVTCLDEEYKDFSKWSHCNEEYKVVALQWVTCVGEKCKDFSKWSYCNGWLAQVKNVKIFQSDLIVLGDLSRWKM